MSAWLEKTSERTAKWLVTKPRQVAVVLAVMIIGSIAALPLMRVESGSATFVADDDPAQKFLKVIEREFVSDDVVFIAYEADDPFAKATLEEIRVISDELAQVGDGLVDEVVSLTTVKDVRGANSTFRSVLLVPEDVPSDPAELNDIRAHAKSNWLIREGLISATSPRLAAMCCTQQTKRYNVRES